MEQNEWKIAISIIVGCLVFVVLVLLIDQNRSNEATRKRVGPILIFTMALVAVLVCIGIAENLGYDIVDVVRGVME